MTTRSHDEQREARQLALSAIFEADFGQRTAQRILERRLAEEPAADSAALMARELVAAVVEHRDVIDAQIGQVAPKYPVVQLARIDRALLRCAVGELLHSRTTPARVAIAEWVELARTYRRTGPSSAQRCSRAHRQDRQTGGSISDSIDV